MLMVNQLIGFGAGGDGGNDAFTKLLLHMDGADASTTFTDSSTAPRTVTANGNAQIDTAQSKFGGSSGLFDGTDDFLNLDGSSDFAFGTGDFTVEGFVRLNTTGVLQVLYDGRAGATNGLYPTIYVSAANKLMFFQSSADRITGTTSLTTGVWYHWALARAGTSSKLFLDGTQEGSTYSDSNNYINGAATRPIIGANAFNVTLDELNGWLDEIRVSKGIARWTANFTPPTGPYF